MFDIGWSELVLVGVVALIVIGPKELPGVLRMVGQWTTKIRRMAAEFQGQFNEALREAEMADLKKQVDDINETARSIARFDPLADAGTKPATPPAPDPDAGESALVDASSSSRPALHAVNDVAARPPADALPTDALPPDALPPVAGGAEPAVEPPNAEAAPEPTPPVAAADAGAPSTEPRPTP